MHPFPRANERFQNPAGVLCSRTLAHACLTGATDDQNLRLQKCVHFRNCRSVLDVLERGDGGKCLSDRSQKNTGTATYKIRMP